MHDASETLTGFFFALRSLVRVVLMYLAIAHTTFHYSTHTCVPGTWAHLSNCYDRCLTLMLMFYLHFLLRIKAWLLCLLVPQSVREK
ncbi:hypothetical protein EDB85DRAFT_1992749 [Lactarius pseudohatsudake]|nr:hypothetical protein EDB85DRAFT_1992749 [Lactarius pseudohatsudake]